MRTAMTSPDHRTDRPQQSGSCDCDSQLSRRSLLKGLGLTALAGSAFVTSPAGARYAYAAGTETDTLVVLSLRGGFDGLSALAPIGDPGYATLRGANAVSAAAALQVDQTFGLHPALAPLKPLWDAGQFAAVSDVGQVAGTRSHFEATAEMERAAPGATARTGWLDRLVGLAPAQGPFTSTAIGAGTAPRSMVGPTEEMTMGTLDGFRLSGAESPAAIAQWSTALRAMHAGGPALVSGPVLGALDALGTVNSVTAQYPSPYSLPAGYPRGSGGEPTELSRALDDTARLLKAGVNLRVVAIDCGNWDMHEYAGVNSGWMFNQLGEVAKALAAFAADLGPLFARTTVVTMSEFGRRVAVNGTGGFDHGHGNQMFVLGGSINGGKVHGTWSGLSATALSDGDLPGNTDYRSVLGSILTRRMAVSTAELATVFPNPPSSYLDIAKPRS